MSDAAPAQTGHALYASVGGAGSSPSQVQPQPFAPPLRVGNAEVPVPFVPAPNRPGWYIQHFDLHEQTLLPIVFEAARLIHEAADPSLELYTVESSTYEVGFLLRTRYGRQVVNIHKRLQPSFTAKNTEHVVYHPFTADAPRQLFFPKRSDPSARMTVTLFDTTTTSGQTLRAAAEALQRQNIYVEKAIVLFTEAEEGQRHLQQVVVSESYSVPIHAFGQLTMLRQRSDSSSISPQARALDNRASSTSSPSKRSPRLPQLAPLPGQTIRSEPLPPVDMGRSNDSSSGVEDEIGADAPLVQYSLYSEAKIPTLYGNVQFAVFTGTTGRNAICVVGKGGELDTSRPVLVRLHDACITSECFKSCKCDCREQLEASLEIVCREGGMVIYLLQEGRGIGLAAKIAAYALQETQHLDTVDANRALGLPDDARTYEAARDILSHFGVSQVLLLSNNPLKRAKLEDLGVNVVGMQPVIVPPNSEHCRRYMETKAERMQHLIPRLLEARAAKPAPQSALTPR